MSWYEPVDVPWTYASPRLFPARTIVLWIFLILVIAPLAVLAIVHGALFWWIAAGVVVMGLWLTWLIWRQVTAHAWAERDDDLLVKRGRMYRSLTVVPYGRMQYVEVSGGPLARALGIATIQLHTASPGTDATLSGVPAADAEQIRDRISARGEARLAGL